MSNLTTQSLDSLLTFDDLAVTAGISRRAISKRKGIDNYFVKQVSNGGRPIKFFHPEALKLFGIEPQQIGQQNRVRKIRTDINSSRVCSEEMEMAVVNLAFEIYLSQANRNYILNSVQRACIELWNDEYASIFPSANKMAEYFYKRRIMGKSKAFIGYAVSYPSWQTQWERKWKKSDVALKRLPTARYSWLDIMEDAGIIGPGFGAGRIWFLDDHIGDSFLYDSEKVGYKGTLPKGLFMVDGVTGMFLDYMPGEVNSISVGMMIIRNVLKLGLPLAIGLENSRAMRNIKLDSAINSLYSDDVLNWYRNNSGDWFHELFERASTPVVRNLPNIPRSPFKARLERLFQEVKKHDGWYFPETYQGGGLDPVQLRVSNTPKQPLQIYNVNNYTKSIVEYLSTEYLQKERANMFEGFFNKTGLTPTVENVWNYYGGFDNAGTKVEVDSSKFATTLYWLSEMDDMSTIIKRESKAYPGRVSCKVKGREYIFVEPLLARYEGQKIAIVFIPDTISNKYQTGDFAALFAVNRNKVEFINICQDQKIRTIEDVGRVRANVRETRKVMNALETPYEVVMNKPHDYAKELKATTPVPKPEVKKLEEPKIADDLLDLINL